MANILTEIINHKKTEVAQLKTITDYDLNNLESYRVKNALACSFYDALTCDGLSVIAEIKRRSPSKGQLSEINSPVELALQYAKGGANAISVLTDNKYFAGDINDLSAVSNMLKTTDHKVSLLRKDFIIDPVQIIQAALAGANAILLIVSVLRERTADLLQVSTKLNLDVLVEVRDIPEIKMAVASGAKIIGINNRNLNTFEVNLRTSCKFIQYIPDNIVKVSESGIHSPVDAKLMQSVGFDAILVGEALVTADNPTDFIQQLKSN
ncbi:MAG: indole-3-glycerol phosphate synthase [Legionellales bacterium]|nr:MAG: indole-3-glycerol phosphate synthase [Legionellales bacterium]